MPDLWHPLSDAVAFEEAEVGGLGRWQDSFARWPQDGAVHLLFSSLTALEMRQVATAPAAENADNSGGKETGVGRRSATTKC